MNIALYGYGKMGKAIEQVAVARGHQIILRVDHGNAGTPPTGADVAIKCNRRVSPTNISIGQRTLRSLVTCSSHFTFTARFTTTAPSNMKVQK